MKTFKITYIDPATEEERVIIQDFEDTVSPNISAREWAEDFAYSLADKGEHKVEELEIKNKERA